jgi:hypothetical protein
MSAGAMALLVGLYLLPLSHIVVRQHLFIPIGPPFLLCALLLIWRRGLVAAPRVAA